MKIFWLFLTPLYLSGWHYWRFFKTFINCGTQKQLKELWFIATIWGQIQTLLWINCYCLESSYQDLFDIVKIFECRWLYLCKRTYLESICNSIRAVAFKCEIIFGVLSVCIVNGYTSFDRAQCETLKNRENYMHVDTISPTLI